MESMAFSTLSSREGVGDSGRRGQAAELLTNRIRVQWLGDARVRPGAEQDRNHRGMPGHAENSDVARLGDPAQAPARLDPVEAGYDDVEDDHGGTERPDLDERLVAVGRDLDRERLVGQEIDQHTHDERLVVHDEKPDPRSGAHRIVWPSLSTQEALKLREVDAAVATRRPVGAQGAGPYPAPKRRDRDSTVDGRLPGRQVPAAHVRRTFHFLHI